MHSYFETLGKYLFTKYLTYTNMPTAQQNKGHKKNIRYNTAQIREALLYVIIKSFDCAISYLQHLNKFDCTTIEC